MPSVAPHLIALAGLRRGEALGLHWADLDLDLDSQSLTVRWQLVDGPQHPRLGPPKTRSGSRVVQLDSGTCEVLRDHRDRQQAERSDWAEAWVDSGLVFTRENGVPLRPDFVTHLFVSLARATGSPPIRLHDLCLASRIWHAVGLGLVDC